MTNRTHQDIGRSIEAALLVAVALGLIGLLVLKTLKTAGDRGQDTGKMAGFQGAPPRVRHLSQSQVNALEERLKLFPSQHFWIIAETGEVAPQAEEARFGEELRNALVRAGWIASQKVRQRMGRAGFQERTMYRYSHGGDSGLVIFAAPDSMRAGTAINSAFSQMLFRSSVERDDNLQNAILIFVGSR